MKKKLIVAAMAAMPMMGMFGGNFASAAIVDKGDGVAGNNNPVNVTVSHSSTYSVVIPKEITLEKVGGSTSEYSQGYTVEVTGDIAADEQITVQPEKNGFELTQANKGTLSATVNQPKTTVTCDDLTDNDDTNNKLNGTVTAQGVKAGTWKGTFNFDISLTK